MEAPTHDCLLSMVCIVALFVPCSRRMEEEGGITPQLYADNVKCSSYEPDTLRAGARFAVGHVKTIQKKLLPANMFFFELRSAFLGP